MTVKLFFLFENFPDTNFAILQTKKQRYEKIFLIYWSNYLHRTSGRCIEK